ncbi:thermonuclease family protein [Indiicoccus explosivorum]|uniref:thermonuclease family protein n=1 Tax=Indiicoccus explosivorum TaxID=1917864 RepID=UPI001F4E2971|nr:thermonuclease family protein [Indiicoccus explosivorum]
MNMKRICLAVLLLILSGCASEPPAAGSARVPVELLSVTDGDTIDVILEGERETIRYLLIDTPELRHPESGQQPLSQEAAEANRRMLETAELEIEFDEGERTDDYGRLLAYVYADGKNVQEELLRQGLARVAYVFPPSTRYLEAFEQAETAAREAGRGIWRYSDYATERGFDVSAVKEESAGETLHESGCTIKGNINRDGEKIYHWPGSLHYEKTVPEVWFCSEAEAAENGFRKSGQ